MKPVSKIKIIKNPGNSEKSYYGVLYFQPL